jgi:hypothetical protein
LSEVKHITDHSHNIQAPSSTNSSIFWKLFWKTAATPQKIVQKSVFRNERLWLCQSK